MINMPHDISNTLENIHKIPKHSDGNVYKKERSYTSIIQ